MKPTIKNMQSDVLVVGDRALHARPVSGRADRGGWYGRRGRARCGAVGVSDDLFLSR